MSEVKFGSADLSTCDREPIHIPGSIQPHGALFALRQEDLLIEHVSANVKTLLGLPPEELLGKAFSSTCRAEDFALLQTAVNARSFKRANPLPMSVFDRSFQAIVHRSEDLILVELEPTQRDEGSFRDFSTDIGQAMFALQHAETLQDLFQTATEEIRRITGYDRVMVYRFDADGHGEVVAEALREGLPPFLGQHYPESDIPAQARRLYVLNWLRLIADARYTPAPLVPQLRPNGKPLDLSYAVLRSVSPIHLEYLENMGVRASMSISLVQEGKLWGMVACHHYAPHFVPYHVRMSCEFLGQSLSLLIASKAKAEENEKKLAAASVETQLVQQASVEADLHTALLRRTPTLAELVSATGVGLRFEGRSVCIGKTPPPEALAKLYAWLNANMVDDLFVTDCVSHHLPELEPYKDCCSGVLAVGFSSQQENYAVWFRPEAVQTIRWGGDPNAGVKSGPRGTRLTPRGSFQEWSERTRLRSLPWESWETEIATELRSALFAIALRRAAEVEKTRELFLGMLGHDLRNPLGAISLSARALSLGEELPERAQRASARITSSTTRMQRMIEQILDFTRSRTGGGLKLTLSELDLPALAQTLIDETKSAHPDATLVLVDRGGGRVCGDGDRLAQVLSNLLSNARVHGAQGAPITVTLSNLGERAEIAVHNDGAAIPPELQASLFDPFRQGTRRNQQGLGLGLYIVKQIVEAHGGEISVTSAPGEGTTFWVRLPRKLRSA